MTCGSAKPCHTCTCHDDVPCHRPGGGLALHATAPPVRAKLHQAFDRRCTRSDAVIVEGHEWLDRASAFMQSLTPIQRDDVRAALVSADGRYDPWHALPADELIARIKTPWLPALLNENRLSFRFQPIADLSTGAPHAFEALVRGDDGETCRDPLQLIDASRAHRALLRFDQAARRIAIETGGPQLIDNERLFVNFLPLTIYDPNVCLRTTFAAARRAGVPFERIVFEVVESERFPDINHLRRILAAYREVGAGIALDDLGAGYTALTYIDELMPDYVKLDKSLIPHHPQTKHVSLVAGIVHHAKERGIHIIAEGIETHEQLELAHELEIEFVQGFLVAKPEQYFNRNFTNDIHQRRRAA